MVYTAKKRNTSIQSMHCSNGKSDLRRKLQTKQD